MEKFNFENTPFAGSIIRITQDGKYASVIDFIGIVSESIEARSVWKNIKKRFYEMAETPAFQDQPVIISHQFIGERQRPTPAVTARGIIELLFMIPGRKAFEFRRQCCEIMIRYMGGDESLIAEIYINRTMAENGGQTSNAFFQSNITPNNLPSKEETELKLYAAKLELELQYLAKKMDLHKQHFSDVKDHVSYPPARKQLIPEITILAKNEELPPQGDYKKHQKMDFYIIRSQRKETPIAVNRFKRKYPHSEVIDKIYHSNPTSFFNGCQEHNLIKRYRNHFSIVGKQSEDKVNQIKGICDKMMAINNIYSTTICLNKSV
jgi:Protein of unknown function (DUF3627)